MTAHPLSLVGFDESRDCFNVVPETLDVLATFPEPLAVLCIAGLFRTGKSFLLNRVILNAPRAGRRARKSVAGFGVGNTVQAHTKGIWMWSEPIVVKNSAGMDVNVLVLDTEGTGSPAVDASHDARVSSLGLLLSSYFVYNSVGRIDDSALSALSTITHVTSEMREEDAGELPGFLWLLRDFALQLTSADGSALDADAYMEEQLSGEKNDARAHLRKYFKDRGCATLIRPVTEESQLQNLNELSDKMFRPEFLEAAVALRERILGATAARVLVHDDTQLSGSMLGTVVTRYVTAVNNGAIPHIADAWESVCAVRLAEVERHMLSKFPLALAQLFKEACDASRPAPAQYRTLAFGVLATAWAEYEAGVHRVSPDATTPGGIKSLLTEQAETSVTRYEVEWMQRVGGAAASTVEALVRDLNAHDTWESFWAEVQTRMSAFEAEFGRDDATMLLLLRAAQRLWDVVPVFFGKAAHAAELAARVQELEDEALVAGRAAAHETESLKLRMQGADKRVVTAEEESDEMRVLLTKAQEEVRGMSDDMLAAQRIRAELAAVEVRARDLEDALTQAEDDASLKAAEAHAAALKSVDAVKELRAADAKRWDAEGAELRASRDAAGVELEKMKQACEAGAARSRATSARVATLTEELQKSNECAVAATRELRAREDDARATATRVVELERQMVESDERARKRPRVSDGDALQVVRMETELRFLRHKESELAATVSSSKARCVDLERQVRTVQRSADDIVQRERLKHESELARLELRLS